MEKELCNNHKTYVGTSMRENAPKLAKTKIQKLKKKWKSQEKQKLKL